MNAVAFRNPTTGLGGGFLLVLHTKQLSKTSLISFEIPVENNPAFPKDFEIIRKSKTKLMQF